MRVKLISTTSGAGEFEGKTAEDIIVYAARVSSTRDNEDKFKDISKLLGYCIRNKHWSIFETASMTVDIKTSRAIGTQLLRHRSFTFQELSQRYATTLEMEDIEIRKQHANNRQSSTDVFNPTIYTGNAEAVDTVRAHLAYSKHLYKNLLEAGVARECARMVLPMTTTTNIFMTGSIRSWIHFLQVREDAHAQKEIQDVAKEIRKIFKEEFPIISKALNWY